MNSASSITLIERLAPSEHYAARLRLLEAIDALAFHSYHVAEHHGTPLGLAPSPNVYLSAVSQRTRRLLFGPMVYVAALYHPLRLAEEICMLDHLSNAGLQVGLGRGAVWIEHELYGVERARVPQRYAEALDVLLQALTSDRVDFAGRTLSLQDVGIVMRPLQRPIPPLWRHCESRFDGLGGGARRHVSSRSCRSRAPQVLSRYREEWAKLGKAESALPASG